MGTVSEHVSPIDAGVAAPAKPTNGLWAGIIRLYPALAVPDFRLRWSMSFQSIMTCSLCNVATGYAALRLSGWATAIGVVTMLGGLPMLVLASIGGVVADRFPRKAVMFFTQGLLAAGAVALAVLSLLDILEVWHLGALGLVQGVAFSFNMPRSEERRVG